MNLERFNIRLRSHYVAGFLLVALVAAVLYLTAGDGGSIVREEESKEELTWHGDEDEGREGSPDDVVAAANESSLSVPTCNLFAGKWVYDDVLRPLYEEVKCSFMLEDYACEKYGRKDVKYQKWRWQPHHCDLPRFEGRVFLEKMRGKRVVFVGDSLNKNQWTSMLCLLESSLNQSSNKSIIRNDNLFIFKATEYNATIEFYWSPLLVESNCDDPYSHSIRDRIIRITSIEKHAKHWTDADVLIFDAFMWWLEPTMTLLWGSFGRSDGVYRRVGMKLRRFEMALATWSNWLEVNIDRNKTKLFFMSLSPYHFHGEAWDDQCNCYNETEPISKEGYWGIATDRDMMHVAESTLQKLETRGINITYLNITHLSDFRKDAHPSIYRDFFHPISKEQLSNPRSYSDCVHWCLPGVPDVWNEILYSYIIDSYFGTQRYSPSYPLDNGGSIAKIEKEVDSLVSNETSTNAVSSSRCNLFLGKWIYDNVTRPLYEEGKCSFMKDELACQKYGREDLHYQKWRWQPHYCNLPRFDGRVFMEKIRGKRVMYVGDSLNRNQWTSMLCLIESGLDPSSVKSVVKNDNLFIFKAAEYNATIEFYWSPFLVESNCDDPDSDHSNKERTIRIKSIEKHARHWNDADILVFDAFKWWHDPNMTLLWGSFGNSDGIYKRVEMKLRRFEIALTTWSDWMEINLNRTKTKVFFMGISPYHYHTRTRDDERNCYNETEPGLNEGDWGIGGDGDMMHVVESVVQKLGMRGINITYLNITHLSGYRKDAHTSIYRIFYHPLNQEQLSKPRSYSDCVHWCLPGVPDVWNEILYSYIVDS